ncbi:MAG: ATP-binding cassette domain-containing protein [Chloroflexi bacterium]|nr:ATP-binding cassette domain-containing protein [Chloroflexota bacterium]
MSNFRRLLSYLTPYKKRFALSFFLATLIIGLDLLVPMLFGWTISRGLESGVMKRVIFFAVILVLAQGLKSLLNYLQWMVQQKVGQDVVRDIRDQLYTRLQALPVSFYQGMPTGQIMSRLTSDVEAVQEYLGWGFLIQLMAAMSFIGTSVILFMLDWQLTLLMYLPMIVLLIIVAAFDRRIGPSWEAVREEMGKLTTLLQENISGVRVVKAFAREKLEASRFSQRSELNRQRNLDRLRLEANAFPAMDLMVGLSFVLLAWFGALRVISGNGTLGLFFAYQWYLWGIIWPMRFMGWLISMMRQALAAAPRLFEILDAPLKISDSPQAIPLSEIAGDIRFEDVMFAFDDEPERLVLKGFNLHIQPGEVVAILGGTGSGKSLLVNLIGRFQEATEGLILVDGHDVRSVQLHSLREHIGIVPQEPFLFSATVAENIAYGHPDATMEDVLRAAKLAQAHEFIGEMPDGYATQIGERGVRLSGGQKQRLSLARAILVDPAIFILDEATSAVDTRTEHEIQKALSQVMRGRTSLIIAQRLSTVKHADRIVVLKDGIVAEAGTHAELLALGGEYARIHKLQYRESDELAAEIRHYMAQYLPASGRDKMPLAA